MTKVHSPRLACIELESKEKASKTETRKYIEIQSLALQEKGGQVSSSKIWMGSLAWL
ncbi:MAG TPA: hypothetical protein VFO92_01385 [Nitrososphaeraceae archaeon]|nr:hypothetical protein [Nitrososphaeraceae archaeon]